MRVSETLYPLEKGKHMNQEMSAAFCITGLGIAPEEITRVLGITPTKTWLVGESIQQTGLRHKQNGWCIATAAEVVSLEETTQQLLAVLSPKANAINELCSKHDLDRELNCAIYVVNETPAVNFSRGVIVALAEIGASIDVDIILTA